MSKGTGRLIQAGIAKETSRGTAESAATFWIPFSDLSFDEKRGHIFDSEARGIIEDSVGSEVVSKHAEGALRAPVADEHFGLILLATLGAVSTSGPTDSAYTHTFTVAQSAQHQALTVFLDDPIAGADYKYALGVVRSLEISYELKKYLEYNVGLIAKKGATATLTPSGTTENRFRPQDVSFKTASSLSGLGAATAKSVRSLRLSIEKNVENDDVLGSVEPNDFINKEIVITGEIEAVWENEAAYQADFAAGTTKAMRLAVTNADVTIGTGTHPSLTIDLAKATFTELGRGFGLNDVVTQRLAFKAHYSISDSKMVTAALVNAQSSY